MLLGPAFSAIRILSGGQSRFHHTDNVPPAMASRGSTSDGQSFSAMASREMLLGPDTQFVGWPVVVAPSGAGDGKAPFLSASPQWAAVRWVFSKTAGGVNALKRFRDNPRPID